VRKTLAVLVAAGSLLWGIATASPALASADMLVCSPSTNGGTLVKGVCVLPAGNVGQPYEAFIITSANSGGTFSIVAGSLPPGLFMPASFGASGTIVGGTPTAQGTFPFTVADVDQQGHHLLQAYSITIDPPLPLTIVLPGSGSTLTAGTVGVPYAQNFFLSGGVAPYTWSVAAGTLPPGLGLVSTDAPTDNNNQLAGTPTTAGTFVFTMKVTDGAGSQATQQFSLTILPKPK
jgi:large repetitive protein